MEWPELLSEDRYGTDGISSVPGEGLSVFQEDAERIIYTSAFRRLQGKTQVYPFPTYDYLRTRLTHTIEVAYVGRVIATTAGTRLQELGRTGVNPQHLGDIAYAACLAHDLGNPPFGHIGEYAIQTWFEDWKDRPVFKEVFSNADLKNDFLCFDGNAQGFRILTRLASWRDAGGMQLSYAVLGAFSKYPHSSAVLVKRKDDPDAKLKFGFMYSDRDAASKIYTKLRMSQQGGRFCRHPLAFVVEAADDISYLTTDVDDAHRMERLLTDAAEKLLLPIATMGGTIQRYSRIPVQETRDRISYLRSGAAAALITSAIKVFCDNEDALRRGHFSGSLLERSSYAPYVEEIRRVCKQIVYTERSKLQIEAAGYNVILGLMNLYGGMMAQLLERGGIEGLDPRNRGLYNLLPKEFRDRLMYTNAYDCLLALVDYVSGMTDRFALDLFQRLAGTSVALGRMA